METELEYILTHSYKEQMIAYMLSHPEAFDEAIQLALLDKQPYSWRSAWLLWSCMEENDERIMVHVPEILDALPNLPYNQKRELLQVLWKMDLNDENEGVLFDQCVTIWEQTDIQSSVRYRAFINLMKIGKKYPDLSNEIKLLVREQYLESLTPGAKEAVIKLAQKIS